MSVVWKHTAAGVLLCAALVGCRSAAQRGQIAQPIACATTPTVIEPVAFVEEGGAPDFTAARDAPQLLPAPLDLSPADLNELLQAAPAKLAAQPLPALGLAEVVTSIRRHFPLIRQAVAARRIAAGNTLSAAGAFDHKLEASSTSQPLDFYENYRHSLGVKRDTIWGGQTFAGYRIGRGFYEPWYLERETNKGGEFKAGVMVPLVRDRWIDANRAELWQAQLEQQRVEPEIMAQIIRFVRDGSVAYWNWVAAGENYRIMQDLLELANERNDGLEQQVAAQQLARIDLVDNRRIIISRESKLIDAERKLQQASVKLSLFYRSTSGEPTVAAAPQLPAKFHHFTLEDETTGLGEESADTSLAVAQRPELTELQLARRQLRVALRQANNETLPDVDGGLLVAQDVGAPTSSKRDKSEFELEAMLTVSVPLERRKARGKIRSLRGKLAQITAKNRFAADKIVAEVRLARAALEAATQRARIANEGYSLAARMQEAEQELFVNGQSTLFNLNIREQQAAAAAVSQVEAMLEYFVAQADYRAALGYDTP